MLVLAVETSGPKGSLALGRFTNGRLGDQWSVEWNKKAIHSEMATVKLAELMKAAGFELTDISRFIVNAGPGSFTGIRVGLNLVRSLAYALAKPVAATTSLELLAARQSPSGSAFVALKAIQNFYYAATFEISHEAIATVHAPASIEHKDLDSLAKGSTFVGIEGQSTGFNPELHAQDALKVLDRWPGHLQFLSWKEVRPVYIRASEAEEKLLKGLLKREF